MTTGLRVRTLIVDDEPIARDTLRALLRRHRSFHLVGEAEDGQEALVQIRALSPDLVFLDVRMPGMDAFKMLGQLDPATLPLVVFVTAYEHYALRAFQVQALDYLLKPFDDERFDQVASHVLQHFSKWEVHPMTQRLLAAIEGRARVQNSRFTQQLIMRSVSKTVVLPVEDLDWIEADNYYARVHVGEKSYLVRESLTKLAAKLDPSRFARVHRSAIINLQRIREIRPSSVVLQSGQALPTSRLGRKGLKLALTER